MGSLTLRFPTGAKVTSPRENGGRASASDAVLGPGDTEVRGGFPG